MARFDDLAAFAAVVRAGSFTKAAAQLGVTQSALSQTIRTLERRLDLKLLNRTTRSLAPTEAGDQLYRTVEPRLSEIEAELSGDNSVESEALNQIPAVWLDSWLDAGVLGRIEI